MTPRVIFRAFQWFEKGWAMEGSDGTLLTVEEVKFVRDRPYAHMHPERNPLTQNGTPFIAEF